MQHDINPEWHGWPASLQSNNVRSRPGNPESNLVQTSSLAVFRRCHRPTLCLVSLTYHEKDCAGGLRKDWRAVIIRGPGLQDGEKGDQQPKHDDIIDGRCPLPEQEYLASTTERFGFDIVSWVALLDRGQRRRVRC
jgi:hypothetical protein